MIFILLMLLMAGTSHGSQGTGFSTDSENSEASARIQAFTMDYSLVQIPYEITLWIILASYAKIGFHLYHKVPAVMPESCILIAIGVLLGGIIFGTDHKSPPAMRTDIYFLYLLPPIVLEGGYFLPTRPFFENIGTIIFWSVVGTLINAFGIGISLYGICQIKAFQLSDVTLLQNLMYGSLISAVDPVAVLAVFEATSVNEQLYLIIFGESLLNDGITVVLYNIFISLTQMHAFETIEPSDIFAGIGRFFMVGIGGVFFGIIFGFFSAFITRFTKNISSIEPLIVFMFSYLSYLSAEAFYLSGILAMTACAMTMKSYVEENVCKNSNTTIKYFMKMLSSVSETLIFVFMGVSTVGKNHEWNWAFVSFTLLFCLIWRAMSVFLLFPIINYFRILRFSLKDQLIIAYSGLRGASSFSLVFLLPVLLFPRKNMFITSTIVVIYVTVFIKGITIGPLVRYLNVKKTSREQSINQEIHTRLMDHLKTGIADICGHWGHYQLRKKFYMIDNKLLRKALIRDNQPKSSIVSLHKKLERKQAIEMTKTGMGKSSRSSLQDYTCNNVAMEFSSEDVAQMKDLLTNSLYQVRKRTLSYDKYNLPKEDNKRQNREILIRRYSGFRKGHSLPWDRQPGTNVRFLSLPHNRHNARGTEQPFFQVDDANDDVFSQRPILLHRTKHHSAKPMFEKGNRSGSWHAKENVPLKHLTTRPRYQSAKSRPFFDVVLEEDIQTYTLNANSDVEEEMKESQQEK
ncbi:hypothetical protein GDO86_003879 [Hymenochirus boettgeri]|uniref:Sodium/hydrogen exchanger n=1 Tax=Hymenochirus boettgeri TaxID=247094 RepID=A0A8T2KB83_9PIPI|nr:hypothetical protein GDO86_003879 [Hymenochirus boettgeri]